MTYSVIKMLNTVARLRRFSHRCVMRVVCYNSKVFSSFSDVNSSTICAALAMAERVLTLCGFDRPSDMRCAGGGAKSNLWLQIKAEMRGAPILASLFGEPTSAWAAYPAIIRLEMNEANKLKFTTSAGIRCMEPSALNYATYTQYI